jgi:Holliday junction resolvase RusA-like endonuclease
MAAGPVTSEVAGSGASVGRSLILEFDELPPSENAIRTIKFITIRGRKQRVIGYTTEAENYRRAFSSRVGKEFFTRIQGFMAGHHSTAIYSVNITFFFESLVTKGWIQKTRDGTRGAKTPYKMVDVGNRLKLLADCVVDLLSLDDHLTFELNSAKVMDPQNPRIVILLEEIDPRGYGIPEEWLDD